jgi:hypothetical protein
MGNCIDLNKHFGDQYQVVYEESYYAERGNNGRLCDPSLQMMPCEHGHIYPHGGDYLAASTNFARRVASQLRALPCVRVVQDGTDGINVVFHVNDFERVAALLNPRNRRRLTESERLERAERLRLYQFKPATHDADGERKRDPPLQAS